MDVVTGLHAVEDRCVPPFTVAYRCETCGAGVMVDAPDERELAAVAAWRRLHPSGTPQQRQASP